jgi:hypothetical protein
MLFTARKAAAVQTSKGSISGRLTLNVSSYYMICSKPLNERALARKKDNGETLA